MSAQITSAQFQHLWKVAGGGAMPFPLSVGAPTSVQSAADAQRELDDWAHDADPVLAAMVEVLAKADVSVAVQFPGADEIVRRGAVRDRACVVATQTADPDADGTVTFESGVGEQQAEVVGFAYALLAGFGEVSAGRTTSVSANMDDVDGPPMSFLVDPSPTGASLVRQMLAERSEPGQINIYRRSADGLDEVAYSLSWFDIPGDGRYLSFHDGEIHIQAADLDLMVRELASRVTTNLP